MCPGQPYFLVPHDDDITVSAIIAMIGIKRLNLGKSCILI